MLVGVLTAKLCPQVSKACWTDQTSQEHCSLGAWGLLLHASSTLQAVQQTIGAAGQQGLEHPHGTQASSGLDRLSQGVTHTRPACRALSVDWAPSAS